MFSHSSEFSDELTPPNVGSREERTIFFPISSVKEVEEEEEEEVVEEEEEVEEEEYDTVKPIPASDVIRFRKPLPFCWAPLWSRSCSWPGSGTTSLSLFESPVISGIKTEGG